MSRVPSLRELRARAPSNVVILPSAAPRQVQQKLNDAARAARRALRKAEPWPGESMLPGRRDAIRRARAIKSVERTPALRIVVAPLASLDAETRHKVRARLAREARSGARDAIEALAISECTTLNFGEVIDLNFAFQWLAERDV